MAKELQQPCEARDRLTHGLFFELSAEDPIGLMELTLQKVLAAEPAERKLRKSVRRPIEPYDFEPAIAEGQAQGVINDIEARAIREAMQLTAIAVAVDTFGAPRSDFRVKDTGARAAK